MAHAAVATQIHQTLDVHGQFTTQIAFDDEFTYFIAQFFQFAVIQIFDLFVGCYTGRCTDFLCAWTAHTVDGCQADNGMLMIWDINPCNTCHLLFLD
ncbi:hypothetical protein AKG95_25960 [Janthinobacterium lividum]|uniref:Uncharacterized protein n=1 Tax=Janthinobacterium lividum TaxID=29581 RepID=A0A1S1U2I5_9BURK|nr:hypothetical protein AKG95_25960 [Janthinobacterium lividum]